jgi:hypothetical protein
VVAVIFKGMEGIKLLESCAVRARTITNWA